MRKKVKLQRLRHSIFVDRMIAVSLLLNLLVANNILAQTEVMAWGNLTGIRVEGQLMEFETTLSVVGKDWVSVTATGKEKQQPKYHREGETQTVNTELGGIKFVQSVRENGTGSAIVDIRSIAQKDTLIEGVYFCIDLPGKYYSDGTVRINGSSKEQAISALCSDGNKLRKFSVKSIALESAKRGLAMTFNTSSDIFIRKEKQGFQLYVGLMGAKIKKGHEAQKTITIKASGEIDKQPVEIVLDARLPGRKFAGFGGNFRLQNPDADPQVISYCLDHMRVAWGRVEMPLSLWQPDENTDPVEAANAGKLHEHVRQSMLMAQKLAKRGIPIIISVWSAPGWAIIGEERDAYRFRHLGIYGYPLNPQKLDEIYRSIGDYLVYLKQNYGVEPALFSFNESDLGINVRQTGEEHAELIKGLGAHFASRGIITKLLLGDNSDATTFDFILPAMNDPETYPYIGAVSFHSWRGCDDATLHKWAGAANKLNLPLIVAEGSTDAAAYRYPEIFYEQTFALYEINLYMRLCSVCQPLSILQWQLTSDYSVLKGMGIYGTEGPLEPTRRFWNLKQLASTPVDAFALPVSVTKEEVNCTAFGNTARGEYAIHLVNNGAARKATIKGIPAGVSAFDVFITDETKGMEKTGEIKVTDGQADVSLLPAAFITLISKN
jgi:hypothetical protein